MATHLDDKIKAVSDMVIAKLEKLENAQWQKSWINIGGGTPRNISGRHYGGSNQIFLGLHAEEKGYTVPIYLTFLQAKEAGLQIKKGERSFPIFYSNFIITDKSNNKIDVADYKLLSKEEQKEYSAKSFARAYDVFNIDQTNMSQVAPEQYATLTNIGTTQNKYHNTALSSMLENNTWVCPIELRGNTAYYSVAHDIVVVPRPEQFNSQEEFFGTLLHEMSHSTGHEQRLSRDLAQHARETTFRAREELIAELSSALAGMKLGVQREISENNYAYIKSWIEAAKQDNKFVYKAIVDAVKSSDYITEALGIKSELTEKIEQAKQVKITENSVIEEVKLTANLAKQQALKFENNEDINRRFNEQLQRQINGTLPKGHTYRLGNAGEILQLASIPNLPIELQASRLTDKSMQENHPFNLSEVKDLPKAIQNPMAVFRSATHIGSYVIMTEIEHEGKNYVVALEANKKQANIEVNSIRSVHYRNSNVHIANWVNENLLEYADKKRMPEWLLKQRYNSADVKQLFRHAAKITQDFENPKLLDTNLHHSIENFSKNTKIMGNSTKDDLDPFWQAIEDHWFPDKKGVWKKEEDKSISLIERQNRAAVASNFKTPVEMLAELAKDKSINVRESVANNKNRRNLNNSIMDTKNYVGNSYKTVTEKGTFYNFDVKKADVEKIEGTGKRNEIFLAIEPKKEVKGEKYPTHSVYVGDKHDKRELQLVISKDALLQAPVDAYGSIKAFAASREKIGADLSNYSVALEQKDPETDKYQFIGRGYDETTKFGETRVMGTAIKTPLDEYGTNSAKVYNVNLDVSKVSKLTVNEYGDARLGIIPYVEKVLNPDGSTTEQTRYLITEVTSATKGVEATIAIHVSNPADKKEYPTIDTCAVHKVGDNEVYKLVVQDRNPEKIGKDCADLTVSENKYTPEMKELPEVERKAALSDKNYIGRGWTNDPYKIRIDHKCELNPEGLTKAIDNNHTVKVMAILNKLPNVVRESHVKQLETRNKEGLKTSSVIESRVKEIFVEMPAAETKQKKNSGLKM
jgi:antirestriction protein ArdC